MSILGQTTSAIRGLSPAQTRTAESQGDRPRASRRRRFSVARWVSPVVVLIVWQLAHVANLVSSSKLPPPSLVVSEGWTLITSANPAYGGTLQHSMLISLGRFGVGFAAGGAIAMAIALIAGLYRSGEAGIDPLMQAIRTLPLFGLIPVFIVWFGIGEMPKYMLVAVAAAVPLYLNAFSGIRAVDGRLHELGQVLRLSRREMITQVILPGAMPSILVGVRQSLGTAWLALVVAEQFATNAGLGFMITQAESFNQNDVIFVCLIVYTILGLLSDWIVRILERRALAWRPEAAR